MKKVAIVAAMLTLAGCVQVDNYQEVIKHPVPSPVGYWQSKGPQSAMVSPEAIATLVVTPEGGYAGLPSVAARYRGAG